MKFLIECTRKEFDAIKAGKADFPEVSIDTATFQTTCGRVMTLPVVAVSVSNKRKMMLVQLGGRTK